MPVGALDLGSNSFLLLLAEVQKGQLKILEEEIRMVRLGQDVDRTGQLQEDAMQRSLDALADFAELCHKHGVQPADVVTGGTSALRDANNSHVFAKLALEQTGFRVHVISGQEEAGFAWDGVLSDALLTPEQNPALLDIGGGSTELLWNKGSERISIDMGVVRASERLLHHDPPLPSELKALDQSIVELLGENKPQVEPLFAVGGVVTTLVSVREEMEQYDSARVHKAVLLRREVQALLEQFCGVSLEERRRLPGLLPQRADLIIAGSQILLTVMEVLGLEELTVSERGLRYGLLLEAAKRQP
jgi:exopolyphosphatase/guanosine-5'-triphosphate,3'-diphosphate pyrophosphatase